MSPRLHAPFDRLLLTNLFLEGARVQMIDIGLPTGGISEPASAVLRL